MVLPPVDRTEALELINFSTVLLLQVGMTKWTRGGYLVGWCWMRIFLKDLDEDSHGTVVRHGWGTLDEWFHLNQLGSLEIHYKKCRIAHQDIYSSFAKCFMESFMKTHNSPAYHWIYSGKMIFLLRNYGWWYYISWKEWIPFVDSDFPKLPLSAKAVAKAAVRGKTPGRYQRRWVYSLVLDGEYFWNECYTCSKSVTNFIDFRLRWLDNVVSALISPCHIVINQVHVGEVYPHLLCIPCKDNASPLRTSFLFGNGRS